MFLQRIILSLLAGIGGLWIATEFVPNVSFDGSFTMLLITGSILGIINLVIKPVLSLITLPIRILTLGLSSILLNVAMVWVIDIAFKELKIEGLVALFLTTLAVWGATMLLSLLGRGKV